MREIVGAAVCIPVTHSVAQTTTPAAHGVHVFGKVEQVRADAADLAEVLEGQGLGFSIAVRGHQREGEDGRIVLRRPAAVADLDDAVHGAHTVRLDAADHTIVVLLHEIAFADVVSATLGTEDQEAVEPRPVIHGPRIAATRVADLSRTRNRLRLRRDTSVEELCVVDSHVGLPFVL